MFTTSPKLMFSTFNSYRRSNGKNVLSQISELWEVLNENLCLILAKWKFVHNDMILRGKKSLRANGEVSKLIVK